MNSLADLVPYIVPELILIGAACVLFLMGVIDSAAMRRACAVVALLALIVAAGVAGKAVFTGDGTSLGTDPTNTVRLGQLAQYIKMLACAVGVVFVLLSWPSNDAATGNGALDFAQDAGEFFALLLLSISGILLVAGANDLILLFLGVELASIPTYIMVSVSRPLPAAQEAGVKYFFLGAMSAAIMLFGFSYFYGVYGTTNLQQIARLVWNNLHAAGNDANVATGGWGILAALMVMAGLAFKLAAVPLHFYAGDVYQGAATPVTALLSFVPKTSGMVAMIKVLFAIGGGAWMMPHTITVLLWVLAVLTMTFGNVLALTQLVNIKRVLAYSSVAHSGYMLVGLATVASGGRELEHSAIGGVLFYLLAYGVMNAAAFGVLMLLPGRQTTTAETYQDIAGQGRVHPGLGLAMAASCFSLIGLPLTIGFFGKVYLIQPALAAHNYWLVAILVLNAAISAGYYLRIVATMFLAPENAAGMSGVAQPTPGADASAALRSTPVLAGIVLSAGLTVLLGTLLPLTDLLNGVVANATQVDVSPQLTTENVSANLP